MVYLLAGFGAYSPPHMGLDAWFLEVEGVWHQFQLCGPAPWDLDKPWPPLNQPDRPPLPAVEQGLCHSVSKDLITWEDRGVILTAGPPGSWDDGKIYTGNVVKHGDTVYVFYTGIREFPQPGEMMAQIGFATSKDLEHWEKYAGNPVLIPDGIIYESFANWRDCNFLWDESDRFWHAVITATMRGEGPMEQRACIGFARSADLIHWEHLPPLLVMDRYNLGLENPFLFQEGGRWYTGYSMYSDFYRAEWLEDNPDYRAEGGVYYAIAEKREGPYTVPENNRLGTQPDPPLYACQIIVHQGERLLLHRGPARWATALPKRVAFREDGSMCLAYWSGTNKARKEKIAAMDAAINLEDGGSGEKMLGDTDLGCMLEARVDAEAGAALGVALGETFLLSLQPGDRRVVLLDPVTREENPDRAGTWERDGEAHLILVADGSVIDVYVNDVWMFAANRAKPEETAARLLALSGGSTVRDIHLDALDTGNPVYTYGFNY